MMQATVKEFSQLTSPAPGVPPPLLVEPVQSHVDTSVPPSQRTFLGTRMRFVPYMSARLTQWLSDWAQTQVQGTGEGLTWDRYADQKTSSTKGGVAA
jgi:hypothetical protein